MRALSEVINNEKKTTGFMVDGSYVKYYDALQNIDLIDNLVVTEDGVIRSTDKTLDKIDVCKVNKSRYDAMCKESPLLRDICAEFEEWRDKWSDYVLYLTGARQTGKTTGLLKFAYKHYEQIIYVNLAVENQLHDFEELVLSNSLRFGMINYCRKERLEEFCNSKETILIIDEIQESSMVYNSIRALQGELNCHVAVTGSYLGKTLNAKYFKPAGNMREIEMLPLSFSEFCRAFGQEELLNSIDIYGSSEKENYVRLTELYNIYVQIGGYPAVVREYLRSHDVTSCYEVIETIISRFTEESASYFKNDKCAIVFENVYKAALMSIAKEKKGTASKDIQEITDFVKIDTKEHVSRSEVNDVISWLKYSKILGGCDLYNQGNVNDLLNERRFYFMDCGIASYVARTTPIDNGTVAGILAENFVYTEIYRLYKKHGLKGNKPCCSIYNNYELDFMLVDMSDKRYGVEVKSKRSNKTESLKVYKDRGFIDEAYVAEITRGGKGKEIRSIPIYTVGCRFPYN
nr:AAA family ATPase [uncultured Agathobacter sp.]